MIGKMWFKGPVPEAIAKAKRDKTVFVVFVEGEDDVSRRIKKHWESADITYICKQEGFVCLNLRNGSDSLKQFAAVYPVVSIPIAFFIGINGKPIDVLTGEYDEIKLAEAIGRVVEIHDAETKAVQPGVDSSVPLEERLQRAREKVAQKREEKAKEKEKEELSRELRRREEGQLMAKAKAEHQEREIMELAEQRRKAKIEDKEALKRIKEQIAQDRAEKARKYDTQQTQEQKLAEEAKLRAAEAKLAQERAAKAAQMSIARLQFRIPNEPNISSDFDADAALGEVYAFVAQKVPYKKFSLLQMYPRQELADRSKTLRELDLVPSAVVLVLPEERAYKASSSQSSNWFQLVWTALFWPLGFVYTIVCGLFGGGSRAIASSPSTSGQKQPTTSQDRAGSSKNIVRMTDRREEDKVDDDKDRPTWNGNSTQQL